MRHRKRGRHLGRTSAHREAMRRNLVSNLFLVGRVRTTPAKAKEVRPMAEKLITLARKGDVQSFRRALAILDDKYIVRRLFREIAPGYADRPGGYVRILHLSVSSRRLGDNAPQVILELLPSEATGAAKSEEKTGAGDEATSGGQSGR